MKDIEMHKSLDHMKIFTGNANPELAKEICDYVGIPLATVLSAILATARSMLRSTKAYAARTFTSFSQPANQATTTSWNFSS